jgi:hypothetical protein
VPIVLKSGSLNLLESSRPLQGCNGIVLLFFFNSVFVYEKTLQSWWLTCYCLRRTRYSQTFLCFNLLVGYRYIRGCRFVVALHGSTAFVYLFFSFNWHLFETWKRIQFSKKLMGLLQIYCKSKKSVISSSFTFYILSVIFAFSFVTVVMYGRKGRIASTVRAFRYSFKLLYHWYIYAKNDCRIVPIFKHLWNTM